MSLWLENIHIEIAGKTICKSLNIEFNPGEIWGVLGRNGSGKTTLLHVLANLMTAQSGKISLDEQPLCDVKRIKLARKIGILLQNEELAFPVSVWDAVLCGRHPHIDRWQQVDAENKNIVQAAIDTVDLRGFEKRDSGSLSGGERRRVFIATLFAQNPEIMLLDEPLNHLDIAHQMATLKHFKGLADEQNKTIICVLHDLNRAMQVCDKFIFLYGEGEVEFGDASKMMTVERLELLLGYPIELLKQGEKKFFSPVW